MTMPRAREPFRFARRGAHRDIEAMPEQRDPDTRGIAFGDFGSARVLAYPAALADFHRPP
jgi:hypothetical protein